MNNNKNTTLWKVTRGQRLTYFGAILSMGFTSVFIFGPPIIGRYALDVVIDGDLAQGIPWLVDATRVFIPGNLLAGYLWLSGLFAVISTAIAGVFLYLRGRLAAVASEAIVKRVREELYRRLHHLKARFYDDADTGDLVQRCSSDVETLRVFLSSDIVEIGRAVILLFTVIPILFWMYAPLAWVSLCLMPFLVLFAYIFFSKVKQVFQVTDEAEGELTAVLQENLTGIRVVRAFARQEFEIDKFAKKNAAFRDHNNRLIRLMGIYWASSDLFAMGQIGVVLITGGFWAMSGSISIGTLFAFITYESMVIWPVRHLGRVLTDMGKATVSLGRINEILSQDPETDEPVPSQGRANGDVVFDRVCFAYDGQRNVIRDFSLHIPAGETLAVVGAPGAGKSTLIRLLLRLYRHQSGRITLDGHDIACISRHWLRRQIGVVLQDPFLYSRSIHDNLLVGRSDAPESHVEQAAEDAAIHAAIRSFPLGYQAMVGERGVTLSGGQRQRLALARALLKDPPVLVLDDSLSAVDTGTERHILNALKVRKGRHTTIVIAHRLSSVIEADRILVMEQGRCVQLGDHRTLAAKEGPYQRLCQIQGLLDAQIDADISAEADSSGAAGAADAADAAQESGRGRGRGRGRG